MVKDRHKRILTWLHGLGPERKGTEDKIASASLGGQSCLLSKAACLTSSAKAVHLVQASPIRLTGGNWPRRSIMCSPTDRPDHSAKWTVRSYASSDRTESMSLAKSTMSLRGPPHRLPQSRLAHFRKVSGPPIPPKSPRHKDRHQPSYRTKFDQRLRSFDVPADRTMSSMCPTLAADVTSTSIGTMLTASTCAIEHSAANSSRTSTSVSRHRHRRKPVPYSFGNDSPPILAGDPTFFGSGHPSVQGTAPAKAYWAPLRTPSRRSPAKATPSRTLAEDDTLDALFEDVIGMLDTKNLSAASSFDPLRTPSPAERAGSRAWSLSSSAGSSLAPARPISRTTLYRPPTIRVGSVTPDSLAQSKASATPRRFPPVPPTPNFIPSGRGYTRTEVARPPAAPLSPHKRALPKTPHDRDLHYGKNGSPSPRRHDAVGPHAIAPQNSFNLSDQSPFSVPTRLPHFQQEGTITPVRDLERLMGQPCKVSSAELTRESKRMMAEARMRLRSRVAAAI